MTATEYTRKALLAFPAVVSVEGEGRPLVRVAYAQATTFLIQRIEAVSNAVRSIYGVELVMEPTDGTVVYGSPNLTRTYFLTPPPVPPGIL